MEHIQDSAMKQIWRARVANSVGLCFLNGEPAREDTAVATTDITCQMQAPRSE